MQAIYIGADHGGFEVKQFLIAELSKLGFEVIDLGTHSSESCDYPLIASKLCAEILKKPAPGILICGTGIGMSIAANRNSGIRAALCWCELEARLARRHNNANVLCLGARMTGPELCLAISIAFLESQFEGGRHLRRLKEIDPDKDC